MYLSNNLYVRDIKKIISEDFTFLKNKTFFITGASGLVGSFFIDVLRFLNKNYNYNINIYATFTSEQTFLQRFILSENETNFHWIIQDIMNPIELDIVVDYIIHAASNTHPKLYAQNPVDTMKLNLLGTMNVLDFAKKSPNCKTIFLSTLEIYGENLEKDCFEESDYGYIDIRNPRSCYPESKRACETLVQSYSQQFGLNIITARLGYIYGATVSLSSSKADVQFLNNVLRGENIVLKSLGEQQRSYCYVGDVVSALITLLKIGMSQEVYNISSNNGNVTLRTFAETLAKLANVEVKFQIQECLGGSQVKNSTLSSKKIESLGWKPKFSFVDSLQTTLDIKKDVTKCLIK